MGIRVLVSEMGGRVAQDAIIFMKSDFTGQDCILNPNCLKGKLRQKLKFHQL